MGTTGGLKTIGTGATLASAAAFVLASRILVPTTGDPAAAPLAAMIYACAVVPGALIFLVRGQAPATEALKEAAGAATLAGIIVAADPLTRPLLPVLPAFLLVVYLVCATAATASRITGAPTAAMIFALLALAPVWAAPLVECADNPAWLSGLVIGSSPLTPLAMALDLDYLRTDWFYAHSALGSMRYDYPGWLALIAGLSLVPAGALLRSLAGAAHPSQMLGPKEAHP